MELWLGVGKSGLPNSGSERGCSVLAVESGVLITLGGVPRCGLGARAEFLEGDSEGGGLYPGVPTGEGALLAVVAASSAASLYCMSSVIVLTQSCKAAPKPIISEGSHPSEMSEQQAVPSSANWWTFCRRGSFLNEACRPCPMIVWTP